MWVADDSGTMHWQGDSAPEGMGWDGSTGWYALPGWEASPTGTGVVSTQMKSTYGSDATAYRNDLWTAIKNTTVSGTSEFFTPEQAVDMYNRMDPRLANDPDSARAMIGVGQYVDGGFLPGGANTTAANFRTAYPQYIDAAAEKGWFEKAGELAAAASLVWAGGAGAGLWGGGAGAAGTGVGAGAGSGAFLGEGVASGIGAWDAAALGASELGTGAGAGLFSGSGTGSGAFLGEGVASGIPAWDAALMNAGINTAAVSAAVQAGPSSSLMKSITSATGLTAGQIGSIASTGLGLAGSYLGGKQAQDAAQTSANAQIEAAKIAADAARFRPVGVTSRFGQSQFAFDDKGNLTSAGYTLAPDIRAQQDKFMGASEGALRQYLEAQAGGYQQAPGMMQTAAAGRGGDTQLAHVNPQEAELLKSLGGSGTINPQTGLREFYQTTPATDAQKTQFTSLLGGGDYQGGVDYARGLGYTDAQIADYVGTTGTKDSAGNVISQDTASGYLSGYRGKVAPPVRPPVGPSVRPLTPAPVSTAPMGQSTTAPMGQAAQTMFGLGQGYLSTSPQEQAAKYTAEQQALLATGRERDMAGLQNRLYNQGRLGLSMGATSTGMMSANPELEAFYNAQRQQDLGLAAQATQGGQQYAQFGAGMVAGGGQMLRDMYGTQSAAYGPYRTAMDGAQYLEGLGQNTLDMGINIGAKGAASGSVAGQLLQKGYGGAATTMQGANSYSPWGGLLSGAGSALSQYGQPNQQQRFNPYTGQPLQVFGT